MRKVLFLAIPLSILIALLLFSRSNTQQTLATSNPIKSEERPDLQKSIFAPAKKLLLEKGVQFEV
jgi:hypothetical protein